METEDEDHFTQLRDTQAFRRLLALAERGQAADRRCEGLGERALEIDKRPRRPRRLSFPRWRCERAAEMGGDERDERQPMST
jgi:hypothetical protein